ncbi:SEC16 [Candida metapsilosis]|uniref:Protein transport protein sec16 n=1 Tax=Candida metapsilosis TaxID=273372 RepID=A0A8H7ZFG1_9ASCO|nr:SEC16 [Candida metapsilosis]
MSTEDSKASIDELFGGEEAVKDDDFFASIQQNHPITPYGEQGNLRIDDINYPQEEEQRDEVELSNNEYSFPIPESHDLEEHEVPQHDVAEEDDGDSFFKSLSVPQPREVLRSSIDTTEHIEVAPPQPENVDTQEEVNPHLEEHSFEQALNLGEEDKLEPEDNKVDAAESEDGDVEYLKLPSSSPEGIDTGLDRDSLFNASPAGAESERAAANKDELDWLLKREEGANEESDVSGQAQERTENVPEIQVETQETPVEEKENVSKDSSSAEPQLESKLNELFQDEEDVDFFQTLDGKGATAEEKAKEVSTDQDNEHSHDVKAEPSTSESKEPTDDLVNKLADLDLELDDDLLLDDDFLEQPASQPAQTQPKSNYTPQQQKPNLYAPQVPAQQKPNMYAPQVPQAPQQQDPSAFAQNLAKSKKKSDAYDFPDELIVNKVKPAPRHTMNKYAPTFGTSQSSIETLNSATNAPPPPAASHIASNLSRSSSQSQPQVKAKEKPPAHTVQPKKSFFEDFPDTDLPKPKKAPRAAAPVKAVNQHHPVSSPIQQQNPLRNFSPPHSQVLPKAGNKPPPVNPYMPKSGTSPILQQHVPSAGHTGIAKPGVNMPHSDASANAGYSFPPTGGNLAQQSQYQPSPYPPSMRQTPQHLKTLPQPPAGPPNMYAPPPVTGAVPPPQGQQQQQQQQQLFPPVNNPPHGHAQGPRRASQTINTNVGRSGSPNSNSPYVPNAGPYAPSNQPKTHNRTNSLVGGKGKEVNPYAPMVSPIGDGSPSMSNQHLQPMSSTTATIVPPPGRVRGFSNARSSNIYKTAPKVVNPEELVHRQFPIFNWSNSQNVAIVRVNKAYNHPVISVEPITNLCNDKDLYINFPGPLVKGKSKKKDILNWLDVTGNYLRASALENELILNDIMTQLVHFDGDISSKECLKQICLILNPNINFDIQNFPMTGGTANAYKLDSASINTVFALIQAGHVDKALEYAITKGDWSMALVLANFNGVESFARIASEYARNAFPFSKANNKVLHIMPILLKVLAGNVQSVIQDLTSVANEGDYSDLHWRDIISSVAMINTVKSKEFLIEFGKLLITRDNQLGAEISFILSGLPLGQLGFMVISSGVNSMYTQLYEYILTTSGKSAQLPHLLPIKLKHASTLADYGLINESQKYIDYINSIIKNLGNRSPFVSQELIHEFQNLLMRLSELGSTDQGGWFGSKMSKVNLDKVWGQIDKFIAGDEPKPKSSENGVFSKFSPSTSRNTSTLDLGTLHNYVSPALRTPDAKPQPVMHHASYPLGAAANVASSSFGRPALASQLSSTSVNKYAPPYLAANNAAAAAAGVGGGATTPSAVPHTAGPGSDRYAPYAPAASANTTSQFHPIHESTHQSFPQSKGYSPSAPGRKTASLPYTHLAAQGSTSSLGSITHHPTPHHSHQQQHQHGHGHGQSNSISSVISGDIFQHNVDGASHEQAEQNPVQEKKEDERIETIKESPELKPVSKPPAKKELPQNDKVVDSNEIAEPPVKDEKPVAEPAESAQPTKSNQEGSAPPPPSGAPLQKNKSAPPTMRANPYAPKSGARPTSRRSKYGPGTATSSSNKYGPPSVAPQNGGSLEGDEANPVSAVLQPNTQQQPPASTNIDTSFGVYSEPPIDDSNEASAPPMRQQKPVHGIDDSFEEPSLAESTNILHTPQAKALRLNQGRGVYDPMGGASTSNLGFLDNNNRAGATLDGFPIPGSPESTTRANSVFGGGAGAGHGASHGGGLFSSRLSQSQQSALYQQYEVRDDTVRDYVPVIEEEDDEDDEDADARKKKKQKLAEQEAKAKKQQQAEAAAKQQQQQQQQQAKSGKQGKEGWLTGLFGKNDGKEKPTRAHLGNKNSFYYDEKHKRWLDSSRSIEEQLKEGQAPPPPPSMKKKPAAPVAAGGPPPSSSGAPLPRANLPPAPDSLAPAPAPAPSTTPGSADDTTGQSSLTTPRPTPKPKTKLKSKAAGGGAGANLANAGLDDLLSMSEGTGSGGGGRKAKRAGRRGYVNMMDK